MRYPIVFQRILQSLTTRGLWIAILFTAMIVAAGVSWTNAPEANAQASDLLVGNFESVANGTASVESSEQGLGQEFVTGPDRGFRLNSVVVKVKKSRDGRYIKLSGAIYSVESDGSRGDIKLTDLSHSGTYTNHADYTFEDPDRIELEPLTRYMLVIECQEGCANNNYLRFSRTLEDDEDDSGQNTWSIADGLVRASLDWTPTETNTNSLRISVRGSGGHPYIVADGIRVISTPAVADTYGFGESIRFAVTFNGPVQVDTDGGRPRLTFKVGDLLHPAKSAAAIYVSGSGSTELVFEYAFKADDPTTANQDESDQDANGIYVYRNVIRENGGTIKGTSNNRSVLLGHSVPGTLPGHKINGNLSATRAILTGLELTEATVTPAFSATEIEYTAATASHVGVTTVTATPLADGAVSIEPADADALAPGHQVALDDGNNTITIQVSKYEHITVTYTVDVYREPRVLPAVNRIDVESSPQDSEVYGLSETVALAVYFNEPVSVDLTGGRPKLRVDLLVADSLHSRVDFKYAYTSGPSGYKVVFHNVVTASQFYAGSVDLQMRLKANRLKANGGLIRHAQSGREADLRHSALGRISGNRINGGEERSIARLTGLSAADVTLDQAFRPNGTLYTGTLADGKTWTTVTATRAQGVAVSFHPGDGDTSTPGYQRRLNEGANEIVATVSKAGSASTEYILTITRYVVPQIQAVWVSSDAGSDRFYGAGDTIDIEVEFDLPVAVDTTNGTPFLSFIIGATSRRAHYSARDATAKIPTFSYTVEGAAHDQDGVSIHANSIDLDGGTIRQASDGRDAILDHAALGNQGNHRVANGPHIVSDGIAVVSTPVAATDTYGEDETIVVGVTFDSPVVVDTTNGTPTLAITIGDQDNTPRDQSLEYARGTGTPTLEFEYIVQPEDVDSNGIAIRSNRLELNGGTIRHATTGVDATLDYTEPGQNGNFPDHNVDGNLVPLALNSPACH